MLIKTLLKLVILVSIFSVSCSTDPQSKNPHEELIIFAAASLTDSFKEIANEFETLNNNVSVIFNFAGSQQLSTQLLHGANADIFASADWIQMNRITESDLSLEEPQNFASNQLVVIVPTENASLFELSDLTNPGTKVVVAHTNVPAGTYTNVVINKLAQYPSLSKSYPDKLKQTIVSEETNVRNVVQKVVLGEADAGFVYRSDTALPYVSEKVRTINIPEEYNEIANYPAAILMESESKELAQEFMDFLKSGKSQDILEKYGFLKIYDQ
tara:strand:- start:104 stop:913 length:810 start_codon:yes stop_codon:yes gene_type:complete